MNRYNLTPSESAANADKERAFKKAWFQVANLHQTILEAWDKKIRMEHKLIPNVSSFSIHGSEMDFYERPDSVQHFYLKVSFQLADLNYETNPPSYTITLNVSEVLTIPRAQLQDIILAEGTKARNNYRPKDPDYDRNFGKVAIPKAYSQMKSYAKPNIQTLEESVKDWLD